MSHDKLTKIVNKAVSIGQKWVVPKKTYITFIQTKSSSTTAYRPGSAPITPVPTETIEKNGFLIKTEYRESDKNSYPVVIKWKFTKELKMLSEEIYNLVSTSDGITALTQEKSEYTVRTPNGTLLKIHGVVIKDPMISFELAGI